MPEYFVPEDGIPEFSHPTYENELEKILNMIAIKGAASLIPQIDEKEVKVKF
jgi:hypothetical protein